MRPNGEASSTRLLPSGDLLSAWRRLTSQNREAIDAEAAGLPIPGWRDSIEVTWE